VGKGTLSLKFTGELNDRMKGFYRSKYTGPDGEDRYGAVTQFEVRAILLDIQFKLIFGPGAKLL